jgi:hypothetical protein
MNDSTARAPNRDNREVLLELIDVASKDVLDVGCGDGHVARFVTQAGGRVIGIEPNPVQLARARAAAPAGDETYEEGCGENLKYPDGSFDIVIFFNSLHHVPVADIPEAVDEAARVLRPGGKIYIAEPLAEGPGFELQKPVNDETEVRARAYDAIKHAAAHGLKQTAEVFYNRDMVMESFETWRERSSAINPARRALIDSMEIELRAAFIGLGDARADGVHFDQVIRVNLLERV